MIVIAAVAIIVVGPKDLPGMLRSLGKTIGSVKRMAGDFQRQFNDAIKEADLDDVKDLTSSKGFGPLEDARKSMEEFAQTMDDNMDFDSEVEAPAIAPEPEIGSKPAAKKASAKKAPAKKTTAAKKTTTNKPAVQKTTARKTAPKKPVGKKPAPKKPAPKKPVTETKSTS